MTKPFASEAEREIWISTWKEFGDRYFGKRHEWKHEDGFNNILTVQVRTDEILK